MPLGVDLGSRSPLSAKPSLAQIPFRMIKANLKKHKIPIIIDDGIASYVIMGWDDKGKGEIIIGDPHVRRNNVRVLSTEQFYDKPWMLLLPR